MSRVKGRRGTPPLSRERPASLLADARWDRTLEVCSVRLSCKALLEVVGLRHDEQVGVLLAFDGGWGGGLQTDFELEAHRPAPARS